jgi:hypothetical protein
MCSGTASFCFLQLRIYSVQQRGFPVFKCFLCLGNFCASQGPVQGRHERANRPRTIHTAFRSRNHVGLALRIQSMVDYQRTVFVERHSTNTFLPSRYNSFHCCLQVSRHLCVFIPSIIVSLSTLPFAPTTSTSHPVIPGFCPPFKHISPTLLNTHSLCSFAWRPAYITSVRRVTL